MGIYNEKGSYKATIGVATMTEAKSGTPQVRLDLELREFYDAQRKCWVAAFQPRVPPSVYLAITDATMGSPGKPGWVADVLAYLGFDGNFDAITQLEAKEVEP